MNKQLKSDAAKVRSQLDDFDSTLSPISNIVSNVFDCLNHKDVQYVLNSSKGIRSFRSLKDDSTFMTAGDAGSEAVTKVIGIQKDLKTLDDYVGKMKGFKSDETTALGKLDSVSTHSRVIGSAVEGVANMKNALEQKDTVDQILNNLELVNASKHLLADAQDKKNLDSLIGLEPMIQKMFKSLKEFSGKVTYSDSPVLLDQSSIFKQASSVSGIKGNFSEIGSSIGKLIEKTSDPNDKKKLEEVQSSLIAMDSMGLDFTVYQKSFEDSSVAMEALDIFFRIPPTELEKVGNTLKIAGGSVVVVIVLFLIAYVVMYIFWRKTLIKIIRLVFCVVWRRRRRHKILLEKYVNVFYGYLCQMHKADYINPNLEEKDFGDMVVKLFKAKLKSDEVVRPETSELAKQSPEDRQSENKSYKAYEVELSREGYGKRFYDGHIFSINYPLPNGKHMVAVQAPIADPPTAPPKAGKLWWMIKQLKSKNVVMLCPHSMEVTVEPVVKVEEVKKTKKKKGPKKESEDEDNPPVEKKPREKKYLAGDFFPTKVGQEMTTEEIKLKCISKTGKLYDILKIKVEIP
uniref:Tyrosine-protein phosphatase domain-containing protein n=1 Tax=Caenorhabditis tropicalis TaxID=1561998 RepID=A0A1I7UTB3_9PELO